MEHAYGNNNEQNEYRFSVFKVARVILIYILAEISHNKFFKKLDSQIFVLEEQVTLLEAKSKKSSLSNVLDYLMAPLGEVIEKAQIEKPGKFEYEIRILKDFLSVKHFDVPTMTQNDIRELIHARNNLLVWTDLIGLSLALLRFIGSVVSYGTLLWMGVDDRSMNEKIDIIFSHIDYLISVVRNGLYEIIPDDIAATIHKDKIGIITENGDVIIQHPNDERKTIDLGDYCPICFVEWVKNPESTPKKPDSNICFATNKCRHAFHCSCLQDWSSVRRACPLCQEELEFTHVYEGITRMIVPFEGSHS